MGLLRAELLSLTCFLALVLCTSFAQTVPKETEAPPSAVYVLAHGFRSLYFGFSYTLPADFVPNTAEIDRNIKRSGHPLFTNSTLILFSASDAASPSKRRRGVTV